MVLVNETLARLRLAPLFWLRLFEGIAQIGLGNVQMRLVLENLRLAVSFLLLDDPRACLDRGMGGRVRGCVCVCV